MLADLQPKGNSREGCILAIIVTIAVAIYTVVCWWIPPELFNDTAAGYHIWRAMLAGGPFNCEVIPALGDLAKSTHAFQAWWAPGQYLVPGVLHWLRLSLGNATLLTVMLASVLRIIGFWRLWRTWGVPAALALECGVISIFVRPFSGYFGNAYVADVLQLAIVPWLLLLVWHWRELRGWQCALLVVVLAVGVGAKLSMLVAVLAMLGGIVAESARTQGAAGIRQTGLLLLKAAVVFVVVKFIWDYGYLRRGSSIGAGHGLNYWHPVALTQAWAGPLFAPLGAQSLLNRVFLFPGAPWLKPAGMWPLYLVGAGAMLAVVIVAWRAFPMRDYVVQVLAWLAVYGAAFTWFYVGEAPVSFEERHFLPVGLLVLPCVVFALRHVGGRAWRSAGTGVLAALCVYGVLSFAVNARYRAINGVASREGFTHTTLTRGALMELQAIDDASDAEQTVIYLTKPEIGLEVRRARPLVIPLDDWPEALVRKFNFAGRVPRLVLVLPQKFADSAKVPLAQGEFADYHEWTTRTIDGFLFIEGR